MNGCCKTDLLNASMHKYTVKILKDLMRQNVYPKLRTGHISSYTILTDMLDRFANAVIYWDTKQPLDTISKFYLDLIPKWDKSIYFSCKTDEEDVNLYLRFRMVIDFITSMTDASVFELYKKLNAIYF